MKKHIHIVGASGSGTTTLARALCAQLGYAHFDSDDYFWLPAQPPFTIKRPLAERVALLGKDLATKESWILSGSNCGWGDFLMERYDLVVFLYVPAQVRLQRLAEREMQRYPGGRVLPGGDRYESHKEFLAWAAAYETGGLEMRSLAAHTAWLNQLECPVVRVEGVQSIKERIQLVVREIGDNACL